MLLYMGSERGLGSKILAGVGISYWNIWILSQGNHVSAEKKGREGFDKYRGKVGVQRDLKVLA